MKGRPPLQALREARAIAERQGRVHQNTTTRGIFYDFAIVFLLVTVAVRVKSLRATAPAQDQILLRCQREIALLRKVPASAVFVRELWVRDRAGTWQFFLVLDDVLVEIPPEALPRKPMADPQVKDNAPGPDRAALPGGAPVPVTGFVCPFMAKAG